MAKKAKTKSVAAPPANDQPNGETVAGWSSTIAVIALFSAVQLIVLGILGEYVGRLFQEVKARPLYVIDEEMSVDAQVGSADRPVSAPVVGQRFG